MYYQQMPPYGGYVYPNQVSYGMYPDQQYMMPMNNTQVQVNMDSMPNFTNLGTVPLINPNINQMGVVSSAPSSRRGRKKKDASVTIDENADVEKSVEQEEKYVEHYDNTTAMLMGTIAQIDALSAELHNDIDFVRKSKSIARKYESLGALNSNMASYISSKVQAIKEINSTIKEADNAQYRKDKDTRMLETGNDDKRIMDMYNAFISQPISQNMARQELIGPNQVMAMTNGIPMIDVYQQGQQVTPIIAENSMEVTNDPGYQNYLNNMTPEQRLMRYENNPDVKQCVLMDRSSGAKRFAYMNLKTGEEIQGLPVHGNVMLEDLTIDERNGIARNSHINESYPLIAYGSNNFNGY